MGTNGRNIRRLVNPASHQFRMTAVEIHNTTEAKQKLHDALNILDAISAYSIHHRLPGEQLFDIRVRNDSKAYTQSSRLLSILCWWNRTNSAKIKNIRCRRTVTRSKTRPMISTMCSTGWKPTTSR